MKDDLGEFVDSHPSWARRDVTDLLCVIASLALSIPANMQRDDDCARRFLERREDTCSGHDQWLCVATFGVHVCSKSVEVKLDKCQKF